MAGAVSGWRRSKAREESNMQGTVRKIIKIDEEKCNGCKACIPNCPEGALQIIDGKARLVSDLFCDGLGACLGHCPLGAISVEERAAEPYNEERVMENIVLKGENTTRAHLEHLFSHGEKELYAQAVAFLKQRGMKNPFAPAAAEHAHHGGCPGSLTRELKPGAPARQGAAAGPGAPRESQLQNWPVQIHLLNPAAPYFENADLLIAADCTAFSLANFHEDFLAGKVLMIGCPKLDDGEAYVDKFAAIFKNHVIRRITLLHMEVPCCSGLIALVKEALAAANKKIPLETVEVSLQGQVKQRKKAA
jgi:ferredoxin